MVLEEMFTTMNITALPTHENAVSDKNCGLQSNWPAQHGNSEWGISQSNQLINDVSGVQSTNQQQRQYGAHFYGFNPYNYPAENPYAYNDVTAKAIPSSENPALVATDDLNERPLSNSNDDTSMPLAPQSQYNYNTSQTNIQMSSTFFTTQKISSATQKLSYTPYQLELLNSIYKDMKYPNSVQKTLIAKRIGITRDQVKIWFQNRRRKDTINSQMKYQDTVTTGIKTSTKRKSDEIENEDPYESDLYGSSQQKSIVGTQIIQGVLNELRSHKNAPSRLSSKRSKVNVTDVSDESRSENLTSVANATQISDSHVLKKTPNNCIIDLCPIINKTKETTTVIANGFSNPNKPQDYYVSNSSSSMTATSSSSSSSSGTSSSSEESDSKCSNHQRDIKFQVMQQPFSVQDYFHKKYYQNQNSYYQSAIQIQQPPVHHQQQHMWPQHTANFNMNIPTTVNNNVYAIPQPYAHSPYAYCAQSAVYNMPLAMPQPTSTTDHHTIVNNFTDNSSYQYSL